MIMPKLKLDIGKFTARGKTKYSIRSHTLRTNLVHNIGRESLAKHIAADLENNMLKALQVIHALQGDRDNPRLTSMGFGLKIMLEANTKLNVTGTQTGRIHHKATQDPRTANLARKQGALPTFAQAYGTKPLAAKDPKSEAFINVSKDLGYDITDLYEMDETLKEKIADVVDYEFDKVRVSGDHAVGQPDVDDFQLDDSYEEPEKEKVELDMWDVMAGHKKSRDVWADNTKKEWTPDEVNPEVDIMEEVRKVGARGGH